MIWWIPFVMSFPAPACTPIHGDQILAADMARAIPEFGAAPKDVVIGFSPIPGTRRIFHTQELQRLAARFGVTIDSSREACFEWKLQAISAEEVTQAMRDSLKVPDARIEILKIGNGAAPEGKLVFPLPGLMPAADRNHGPALWRGYVAYSEKRRFDLWVRVKISAATSRVVAVEDISAGHAIEAKNVRVETVDDFPVWRDVARHLDEVLGRVAQRAIPAGHAVLRTELWEPAAIEAGEIVKVRVESGQAHITMDARAENSGRKGDLIQVRNPRSGKIFRARVEAKGKVLVMPGVTGGLVN